MKPAQWVVELTTTSQALMNDAKWEEKYCGEDKCALLPPLLMSNTP